MEMTGFAPFPPYPTQKVLELGDNAAVDMRCVHNTRPSSRGGAQLIRGLPGTEARQ